MDSAEAATVVRAHLEAQFPKTCGRCRRVFRSLKDYLQHTSHVGSPISYDADLGDWRPAEPVGTISFANCRCGTTLTLSSLSMSLATIWRLMAWARRETWRRGISVAQLLHELRDAIDARVLSEPDRGGEVGGPAPSG